MTVAPVRTRRKGIRVSDQLFTARSNLRPHACAGEVCQVCELDRERGIKLESQTPKPTALARRSDPSTSKKAASSLARETMLRALLQEFARADLTSEEVAARCNLDPWAVSKRVSDLLNAGHIEPVYENGEVVTRPGSSGRQQRVLRITTAGSDALFLAG